MQCLNCNIEMMNNQVRTKDRHITYDLCERCGSLWLDRGELDKMAFQVEGDIELCSEDPAAEQDAARQCPRCDNARLYRVRFLGVTDIFLHRCHSCGGFWLDGGQLGRIDDELAGIMPVGGRGFIDFVRDVHVPYWNQRVRRKSSEVEKPVEAMPVSGARKEGATTDACPACGKPLARYTAFHMPFEGCPACKGMWLFRDELRRLKNKFDGGALHWLNDEVNQVGRLAAVKTNRRCPKCGAAAAPLVAAVFGHSKIVLDWCPGCQGVWLDAGALDGVREYLKKELEQAHPPEMEKALREELAELWKGGPESRWAEALDIKATVGALTSATIFEHPLLFQFCQNTRAYLSAIA